MILLFLRCLRDYKITTANLQNTALSCVLILDRFLTLSAKRFEGAYKVDGCWLI